MVEVIRPERFGRAFVPPVYLPEGADEHHLRNRQNPRPAGYWRPVTGAEIELLVKNGNTCDDWTSLLVADPFTPELVKNCRFVGLVRMGKLENVVLKHHDLELPAGITDSLVVATDVGDNCAIHRVSVLGHYIVGAGCILFNIGEMQTTDHAKFGNGIVKDGEPESVRVWMELVNETGTRAVLPFVGMLPADAYLWVTTKEDAGLQEKLKDITQASFDSRRGYYGAVGAQSVIKHTRIIKDVQIGSHCYIKGANKLKNLTIQSTPEEPTQIGEGVELVNGIIGAGSAVFYGSKAVRFIMGPHCKLKYGARLINSFLGDNSTVSCCELLNNLIFPAHEQHHNNSFLTASLLLGQTNLAAGVTAGSNHNSRANDGEIHAGRGFWPGLSTTLKHTCRFASFCLLVKGDYPAELDIRLPFALLSNDVARDRLLVMPAYWWLHNMYALARNTWKFLSRDQRTVKTQHIEFDCLAPDTVEEMFVGMALLERWTGKALRRAEGKHDSEISDEALAEAGRAALNGPDHTTVSSLRVLGEGMENTRRPCVIRKPYAGYRGYRDMIRYYAVKNLMEWMEANPGADVRAMQTALAGARETRWVNMGGQLMPQRDQDALVAAIKSGALSTWEAVHGEYDRLWQAYDAQKKRHAYASLLALGGKESLTAEDLVGELGEAARIQRHICEQVYLSRRKDYENPFRLVPFRSAEEIAAVLGSPEDNNFVRQIREDTEVFLRRAEALREPGEARRKGPAARPLA